MAICLCIHEYLRIYAYKHHTHTQTHTHQTNNTWARASICIHHEQSIQIHKKMHRTCLPIPIAPRDNLKKTDSRTITAAECSIKTPIGACCTEHLCMRTHALFPTYTQWSITRSRQQSSSVHVLLLYANNAMVASLPNEKPPT